MSSTATNSRGKPRSNGQTAGPKADAAPVSKKNAPRVKVYRHVAWLDHSLTAAFFAVIGWVMYRMSQRPRHELPLFFVGLPLTAIAVFLAKKCAAVVGGAISRRLPHHPLKKHLNVVKFQEQAWQLAIHVTFGILDWVVVWNEPWWTDTTTLWKPLHSEQVHKNSVILLYVAQLCVWTYTLLIHRFWDPRRRDYYVMYTHHVATVLLVGGSMIVNGHRIGLLVLAVHDISDITVDLLKMVNYLGLEGKKYFFATEIIFALNLVSWVFWRLYHYPMRLVRSVWVDLPGMYAPNSNPLTGFFTKEVRDIPFFQGGAFGLTLLAVLHVYWFFLFIRLLVRLLSQEDAHKVGREEYEGDSEDEE